MRIVPMVYSKLKDQMEPIKDNAARNLYSDDKQSLLNYGRRRVKSNGVTLSRLWEGSKFVSKVFAEDHAARDEGIIDPGSDLMLRWNWVFLMACILALFVDPLYFYLPSVHHAGDNTSCISVDKSLSIAVTFLRTVADLFYILHIVVKFRTAYVAPSSRVFGRGELVMDKKMIARRYLRTNFIVDFVAALPLPQILIWMVIPGIKSSNADNNKNNALAMIVLFQYFPRLYLIFPLSSQIIKTTGVVTKTAWAGAAYNLILYMLASHVLGASWYLLSLERQTTCWRIECSNERKILTAISCHSKFFDCDLGTRMNRQKWAINTTVFSKCDPTDNMINFNYGIFDKALTNAVVAEDFVKKYLYCLWWGLSNLSSYGQNLQTSTFIGETTFAIVISIVGLILFAQLIGNMQAYLQSMTQRVEEWRLKRRDTEQWMKHRQLPQDLRKRINKFLQYKWLTTRGVDEDSIIQALPSDIRRDIQRHLCLDLVRRVPFFAQMDDQILDAICERLVSSLSTEGTYIVREGDAVAEMLFVVRGKLESSTTNGGRSGMFNSITLRPGDFCGEELLAWALLPNSSGNLPSSTRTVRAFVEVEAFTLRAEDLKFVANQIRRLHSKKLQHTFRYYSHHWRTWASCLIQDAWRRHRRRWFGRDQHLLQLPRSPASRGPSSYLVPPNLEMERPGADTSLNSSPAVHGMGVTILASRFAANARRGAHRNKAIELPKFQKPDEPDFSLDPDEDE